MARTPDWPDVAPVLLRELKAALGDLRLMCSTAESDARFNARWTEALEAIAKAEDK